MVYLFISLTILTVINGLQLVLTSYLIIIFVMLLCFCLLLRAIEEKSLVEQSFFGQKRKHQSIAVMASIIGTTLIFSLSKDLQSIKHIPNIDDVLLLFFCVFGLAVYCFLKDGKNVR